MDLLIFEGYRGSMGIPQLMLNSKGWLLIVIIIFETSENLPIKQICIKKKRQACYSFPMESWDFFVHVRLI